MRTIILREPSCTMNFDYKIVLEHRAIKYKHKTWQRKEKDDVEARRDAARAFYRRSRWRIYSIVALTLLLKRGLQAIGLTLIFN